jgi:hemoglobin/transferrin/lactoferrin receptor protein
VLYFDQHRQLGYLQLRHEGLGALADALRASVSYHRQSEDQFRVRSNLRSDELGFDVYTTGTERPAGEEAGCEVRLVYGADWYHDEVSSYNVQYDADGSIRRVSAQGPVADDASYDLGGLFAQGEVPLGANFTATLAARYTWASVDADTVQDPLTAAVYSLEDDWDNFSASARLAYFPVVDGPWMLYAAVSQAFRAPNLSDLTRFDTALSGEVEVPSPSLDPETYLGWEVGAKFADERWAFQAAWFRTDGSDVIVRAPTGEVVSGAPAVTKLNAADNWVMGIEGEASYRVRPEPAAVRPGRVARRRRPGLSVGGGCPAGGRADRQARAARLALRCALEPGPAPPPDRSAGRARRRAGQAHEPRQGRHATHPAGWNTLVDGADPALGVARHRPCDAVARH